MQFIKTYDNLVNARIWYGKQFWYYVIVTNPMDFSIAGRELFHNLNYFHMDSGKNVIYFIPGFINTGRGILSRIGSIFTRCNSNLVDIPGYGCVEFYMEDFIEFIHRLENISNTNWRYSGECELLLFNVDDKGKIKTSDFSSYNLDDILRNDRNLSSFFRSTINIGKDANDSREAKRQLDEIYANLILPDKFQHKASSSNGEKNVLYSKFREDSYYFISYSSRDYHRVLEIRNRIEDAGVQCWMAPRDIKPGTNYAHTIELAIRHASKFILLLSSDSIWSVWVEKELQRAIHYFQHEPSEKIIPIWLDIPENLEGTPMAYPLEGIQILDRLYYPDIFEILLQ